MKSKRTGYGPNFPRPAPPAPARAHPRGPAIPPSSGTLGQHGDRAKPQPRRQIATTCPLASPSPETSQKSKPCLFSSPEDEFEYLMCVELGVRRGSDRWKDCIEYLREGSEFLRKQKKHWRLREYRKACKQIKALGNEKNPNFQDYLQWPWTDDRPQRQEQGEQMGLPQMQLDGTGQERGQLEGPNVAPAKTQQVGETEPCVHSQAQLDATEQVRRHPDGNVAPGKSSPTQQVEEAVTRDADNSQIAACLRETQFHNSIQKVCIRNGMVQSTGGHGTSDFDHTSPDFIISPIQTVSTEFLAQQCKVQLMDDVRYDEALGRNVDVFKKLKAFVQSSPGLAAGICSGVVMAIGTLGGVRAIMRRNANRDMWRTSYVEMFFPEPNPVVDWSQVLMIEGGKGEEKEERKEEKSHNWGTRCLH